MNKEKAMRWVVEIRYESMSGNPEVKRYKVKAPTENSAIYVAQRKLECLKTYKKTYGGDARLVEDN
jgi:hypothetical protein